MSMPRVCSNSTVAVVTAVRCTLVKIRKVKSFSGLRKQVAACNSNLNTGLSADEVDAVASLLNEQYYSFAK